MGLDRKSVMTKVDQAWDTLRQLHTAISRWKALQESGQSPNSHEALEINTIIMTRSLRLNGQSLDLAKLIADADDGDVEFLQAVQASLMAIRDIIDEAQSSYPATREFLAEKGQERVSQLTQQQRQELLAHLEETLRKVLKDSGN